MENYSIPPFKCFVRIANERGRTLLSSMFLLGALMALGSCSPDPEPTPDPSNSPLKIKSGIESKLFLAPGSKTDLSDLLDGEDKVKVSYAISSAVAGASISGDELTVTSTVGVNPLK